MPKGSCNCSTKVYRSLVGKEAFDGCRDICSSPVCGEPKLLTLLAPVVYDEVGLNLCRSVDLTALNLDDFPTASSLILEVADINLNLGGGSEVESIYNRPYCVRITLSDITVTFYAKILDGCGNLLDTRSFAAVYLDPTSSYDDETNPPSLTVDLYAPYGVSYVEGTGGVGASLTPDISFLGLTASNNTIPQGIVVQGLAKAANFDPTGNTASVGLTLYLKTVYHVQYKVPHAGLAVPPKVEPDAPDIGACISFVEGGLLERNIKPLDFRCACQEEGPRPCAPRDVPCCEE